MIRMVKCVFDKGEILGKTEQGRNKDLDVWFSLPCSSVAVSEKCCLTVGGLHTKVPRSNCNCQVAIQKDTSEPPWRPINR